jgi:hypothetical protein
MRLIVFTCSIIILVMISMGPRVGHAWKAFQVTLYWTGYVGILKLRVVPDMIYGGSVDDALFQ